MVWLDGGSSPPISTVYTGSRQTSRSRPCRLCKQRHGLRGTSDDVFLRKAGNNAGFFCPVEKGSPPAPPQGGFAVPTGAPAACGGYPSQSIIPQGLLWTLNCRKWDMHIYFLAQVLASMIDKIERGGTTAIRRTKLSANSNIIGDKINNIPPMQIRTLLMLYLSFSSLVDVLYPAIKLSPLPVRIIVAKTKTINEIISSNINCAVILKDSDYLIRLALEQI